MTDRNHELSNRNHNGELKNQIDTLCLTANRHFNDEFLDEYCFLLNVLFPACCTNIMCTNENNFVLA